MSNSTSSSLPSQIEPATTSSRSGRVASEHSEKGGTYGLTLIFYILEKSKLILLAIPTVAALLAWAATGTWIAAVITWIAVPLVFIVAPLIVLIRSSYKDNEATADWGEHLEWKNEADAQQWKGKKIPMEVMYEAYMAEKLDFKGDVYETLLERNKLFRFCFTKGDIAFYLKDFLGQNTNHSVEADEGDIAHVYNRGNDFYNWFLGEPMVYTSGIFRDADESLAVAQRRKLETVCKYVQMKPGDKHLDLGCGWGPLITHAAEHCGTTSLGVTLAQEQADWALNLAKEHGVSDRVSVLVDDYRKIPDQKFDKITCLEMAEHVGIKNFQQFLLQVRHMLEDDGIFYLQIAGLRRAWQFEDLVWGLFMGKYIFPAADASCPLGFVTSQVERAGFEVHRVENCGVHYSITIKKWYDNWKSNKEQVIEKYGERWYRMWMIFLAWSVIIAAQGSSTVFMITMTKNIKNDKSSVSPQEAAKVQFSRTDRWVGDDPIATQQ